MFSYQCSLFLLSQATALIDYHIFRRLSTTFYFFLFRFRDFPNHFQATACLLYHIQQPFVKNFFQVFSLHFSFCTFHIPPGLSSVFYFASAVLATKIILSPRFQIVNVFLVFYLIRTIQTILLSFSFCIHNNFIRSFYNNLLKFIFHISFRYFP